MKKITRRSFMAAAGLTVAALALTACGGSSSTASSAAASSVASSAAASSEAASAAATELTTVEAGKLTMATNAAFPPYEMTTDAGEFEASTSRLLRPSLTSWVWSCRSMTWTLTPRC